MEGCELELPGAGTPLPTDDDEDDDDPEEDEAEEGTAAVLDVLVVESNEGFIIPVEGGELPIEGPERREEDEGNKCERPPPPPVVMVVPFFTSSSEESPRMAVEELESPESEGPCSKVSVPSVVQGWVVVVILGGLCVVRVMVVVVVVVVVLEGVPAAAPAAGVVVVVVGDVPFPSSSSNSDGVGGGPIFNSNSTSLLCTSNKSTTFDGPKAINVASTRANRCEGKDVVVGMDVPGAVPAAPPPPAGVGVVEARRAEAAEEGGDAPNIPLDDWDEGTVDALEEGSGVSLVATAEVTDGAPPLPPLPIRWIPLVSPTPAAVVDSCTMPHMPSERPERGIPLEIEERQDGEVEVVVVE